MSDLELTPRLIETILIWVGSWQIGVWIGRASLRWEGWREEVQWKRAIESRPDAEFWDDAELWDDAIQ